MVSCWYWFFHHVRPYFYWWGLFVDMLLCILANMKKAKHNINELIKAKTKRCTMTTSDFIKAIAEDSNKNIKQMSVEIGRGEGSSFSRTVNTEMVRVDDLKKCIECTGQDFIILFKGLKIHID